MKSLYITFVAILVLQAEAAEQIDIDSQTYFGLKLGSDIRTAEDLHGLPDYRIETPDMLIYAYKDSYAFYFDQGKLIGFLAGRGITRGRLLRPGSSGYTLPREKPWLINGKYGTDTNYSDIMKVFPEMSTTPNHRASHNYGDYTVKLDFCSTTWSNGKDTGVARYELMSICLLLNKYITQDNRFSR